MSNLKHTPEPWVCYDELTNTHSIADIRNDEFKKIAAIAAYEFYNCSIEEANANAARIVACVNHCKGATNEELEATSYEQMNERLKDAYLGVDQMQNMSTGIAKDFQLLKDQRDELLAALELYMNQLNSFATKAEVHNIMQQAINKAKGGQQ